MLKRMPIVRHRFSKCFATGTKLMSDKKLIIAVVAWLVCSLAQAADLSGVPRIVDGDTLAIGATKVRLEGIDAPETDQVCLNANGVHWACGIDARDQLVAHIAAREINCISHGTDAYRRTLATCYLAGEDLNGSATIAELQPGSTVTR